MFDTNESEDSHNLSVTKIISGKLYEGFANQPPADTKFSTTQLLKIIRFCGGVLVLLVILVFLSTRRWPETLMEMALLLV